MTEEKLSQYRAACRACDLWAKKIRQLEDKRNYSAVMDSNGPGGTLREITIWQWGQTEQTYRKHYEKRKQEAAELLEEIDIFIDSIKDIQMQQIIELRFKDGMTWQQVADELGGNNTEGSVKQAFYRFMKNCSICSENLC